MPMISIIMGVYDCEKTVRESIHSILEQSFTDWEFIICDDGSKDSTYEIIEDIKRENLDKNIVLIKNQRNMGLNHSLNKCLRIAKGKYIARMDGDDISLPERLEKEYLFLENNPQFSIVSSSMFFFDSGGIWGTNKVIPIPSQKDFIKNNPVHCHAPSMITAEALKNVGGYSENKRTMRFEDVDLWFRLYGSGYVGYNLNIPLYLVRDDRSAAKRRSISSRINCIYVMFNGFKKLKMPLYAYLYLPIDFSKHLIKGFLPDFVYIYFHKKRLS